MTTRSSLQAPPAPADWSTRLREHGLRATPAALDVLGVLQEAAAPMTHEELQHACALRASGKPLDRVTLYRILDRLTEAGLCTRIAGSDRVSRFALHAGTSGHVFECSHCHKVLPLPEIPDLPQVLGRIGRALRRKGIQTHASAVTLKGTCADCGDQVDATPTAGH